MWHLDQHKAYIKAFKSVPEKAKDNNSDPAAKRDTCPSWEHLGCILSRDVNIQSHQLSDRQGDQCGNGIAYGLW